MDLKSENKRIVTHLNGIKSTKKIAETNELEMLFFEEKHYR